MVKPFVKWAGGKRKLLSTLEANLPHDIYEQEAVTYIEPFVGGGAMLFHILQHHPNCRRVIINDINPALIHCYRCIKDNHQQLISELLPLQDLFYAHPSLEHRRAVYYAYRDEYNHLPIEERSTIHAAALFIFFNKTSFNGLYRENKQGGFNVPYGKYVHPTICNEPVIRDAHDALQNVEILCGNYKDVVSAIDWHQYNLFYLDPPYRPLLGANNFKQYTKSAFGDKEQEALKAFCDEIHANGGHFMLSNSDSEIEPGVSYFETLYDGYYVQHIKAPRSINAFVPGVQITTEILVKNY